MCSACHCDHIKIVPPQTCHFPEAGRGVSLHHSGVEDSILREEGEGMVDKILVCGHSWLGPHLLPRHRQQRPVIPLHIESALTIQRYSQNRVPKNLSTTLNTTILPGDVIRGRGTVLGVFYRTVVIVINCRFHCTTGVRTCFEVSTPSVGVASFAKQW